LQAFPVLSFCIRPVAYIRVEHPSGAPLEYAPALIENIRLRGEACQV